jgi:hypothetical protein
MELSQEVWIRDKLYSRDKPVDEPLIYCVIIQRRVCPPGYVAHLPTGVTRREASTTSPAGKKSPILLIASDGECVCVVFKEGSIPGGHDGFRRQPNTERTSLRQLLQRLSAAAAQPLREFRYRYPWARNYSPRPNYVQYLGYAMYVRSCGICHVYGRL